MTKDDRHDQSAGLLIDPRDMKQIEDWLNAGEPTSSVPGGAITICLFVPPRSF